MDDETTADPFADGVLQPEELRGDPPPDQPFSCAACGLAFGDSSETRCPACGADLTAPGALVSSLG
jgi:rubrerythrin